MLNAPHQSNPICIDLDRIRIVSKYRYMFEYKALRIVTWDSPEEYVFLFKTVKNKDKAIEMIQKYSPNLDNSLLDQ